MQHRSGGLVYLIGEFIAPVSCGLVNLAARIQRAVEQATHSAGEEREDSPGELAQGTPLHVVSEVLGHARIAITKDVYGHLLEGDKRAAAESMSRALFGGWYVPVTPVTPSVAPRSSRKAPSGSGKGPLTWRARRDSNPQPSDP